MKKERLDYAMNSKVSIKDLNLYYGDFHALKGVSMSLGLWKIHLHQNHKPHE